MVLCQIRGNLSYLRLDVFVKNFVIPCKKTKYHWTVIYWDYLKRIGVVKDRVYFPKYNPYLNCDIVLRYLRNLMRLISVSNCRYLVSAFTFGHWKYHRFYINPSPPKDAWSSHPTDIYLKWESEIKTNTTKIISKRIINADTGKIDA